jgi:glycosyltransferase involved in cell wall biosynthesis
MPPTVARPVLLRHDARVERPTISIVIPVRNEPRTARAVAAVLAQDGIEVVTEILVVGSGIPDLPGDPRIVRIETGPPSSPGANRNRGIARATGDALIFLDADCIPRPGWLGALVRALEGAPVVSGAVALRADGYWATAYNVSTFSLFHEGLPAGTRPFLATLTLAVRREVVDAAGPLDESLIRCEDMDWTMRMAAKNLLLAFEPRAVVEHRPAASPSLALSKWWQSGAASVLVRKRHARTAADRRALELFRPWALRLLSPALGLGATLRVFRSPRTWRYLHTFPAVYLTKMSWCLGAASPTDRILQ